MRISFVVTVYNKAVYLPHVWAGLLAQRRDPGTAHEYVFVDDASTDGSYEALAALTAGRDDVVLLRQPANAGPAATLNRGVAAARGDLVKLCDSDDVLLPWAASSLARALAETGAEAAFAAADRQLTYDPISGPGALLAAPTPALPQAERFDLMTASLRRPQATPSVWLARRDALLAAGGSDTGVFVQDYSLELRLAARGRIARLDAPVVATPEAAPGRLSEAHAQVLHDVNAALLRFLAGHGAAALTPSQRRAALRRATGRAWLWASRHGSRPEKAQTLGLHALAMAGVLPLAWATEARLCRAFRQGQPLRLPDPVPELIPGS
jgi:Glycosyl transferase family 2